jgi:hypothetical protein
MPWLRAPRREYNHPSSRAGRSGKKGCGDTHTQQKREVLREEEGRPLDGFSPAAACSPCMAPCARPSAPVGAPVSSSWRHTVRACGGGGQREGRVGERAGLPAEPKGTETGPPSAGAPSPHLAPRQAEHTRSLEPSGRLSAPHTAHPPRDARAELGGSAARSARPPLLPPLPLGAGSTAGSAAPLVAAGAPLPARTPPPPPPSLAADSAPPPAPRAAAASRKSSASLCSLAFSDAGKSATYRRSPNTSPGVATMSASPSASSGSASRLTTVAAVPRTSLNLEGLSAPGSPREGPIQERGDARAGAEGCARETRE